MKRINFKFVTLFPELIRSYLQDTLLAKAIQQGLLNVEIIDLRKFSQNKYNSVDDTVFGGGDGMLMQYRPLQLALSSLQSEKKSASKTIYMSPQGSPWNHSKAKTWANLDEIVIVCGRYAGIDQRFIHDFVDEEISIGDFVLSGGELPALAVLESISRFVPGVLGKIDSALADSFEDGLLEAPQFTKAQVENGHAVPAVLLSGNHQNIAEWRKMTSILTTLKKRPDLISHKGDIPWGDVQKFYRQMDSTEKELLGLNGLEIPHDS